LLFPVFISGAIDGWCLVAANTGNGGHVAMWGRDAVAEQRNPKTDRPCRRTNLRPAVS
jgi:hypothetical protein